MIKIFRVFIAVAAIGFSFFYLSNLREDADANEIEQIRSTQDLSAQVEWYKKLIERVGPLEAQEMLYKSGLPFTGQTHLLNHTVGDYLYENQGVRGLISCKDYFLSSCYHGFVLRVVGVGGLDAVKNVMEECKKASPYVLSQCAHAVGHGFLAWAGYKNLPDALEMCDLMEKSVQGFPSFNCPDGVFMENIWAVHEDGSPSPDRWVNPSDLGYPCNASQVEDKYLLGCWSNQPSLMYQLLRGDIGAVGKECLKVSEKYRETCFDGLARQVHPLTAGSVDKTFQLCSLMPESWVDECVITIAGSFFGVGDRDISFQICSRMENNAAQNRCNERMINLIGAYAQSKNERTEWCGKIADIDWRNKCLSN